MNFSQALELLKAGHMLRRKGWATQGATIYLQSFAPLPLAPCVCWCTPNALAQPGWLCSQADMLAEDWEDATPRLAYPSGPDVDRTLDLS